MGFYGRQRGMNRNGTIARIRSLGFVKVKSPLTDRRHARAPARAHQAKPLTAQAFDRRGGPAVAKDFQRIGMPRLRGDAPTHRGKRQSACKPGSVRPPFDKSNDDAMAIPLGRSLRSASSDQPGRNPETGLGSWPLVPIRSCSRRGLPCRRRRRPRGALLPHPFTLTSRQKPQGGFLSVALSLGSPPPDLIRRRVSVEPGLSSACAAAIQPTGDTGLRRSASQTQQRAADRPIAG